MAASALIHQATNYRRQASQDQRQDKYVRDALLGLRPAADLSEEVGKDAGRGKQDCAALQATARR
jgi:hypothetical protein